MQATGYITLENPYTSKAESELNPNELMLKTAISEAQAIINQTFNSESAKEAFSSRSDPITALQKSRQFSSNLYDQTVDRENEARETKITEDKKLQELHARIYPIVQSFIFNIQKNDPISKRHVLIARQLSSETSDPNAIVRLFSAIMSPYSIELYDKLKEREAVDEVISYLRSGAIFKPS